jgi:transposase
MRALCGDTAVYVYTGVLDMRVGFERLAEKVVAECRRAVMSGGYYVFFSRRRDRVRIFYWDRDGYAMWQKRLEAGSFKVERTADGYEDLVAVDLRELLSGTELSRIKFRKNAERGLYS